MNDFEIGILNFIHDTFACPFLDRVMPIITLFGDKGIFWIAAALLLIIIKKTRKTGVMMGTALLLGLIIGNLILKNAVARTRPYDVNTAMQAELLVKTLSDFSFPSGHTGSAFAVAVVVFLMCPRKIGVPVLVFAFVIAFSRLYVGVHFPTDVLGGALIGAVIAYLVCAVYRRKTGQKGSIWNFER